MRNYLVFFHIEQLRYVVIELKTGKFKPEYAGEPGFYVALVDDKLKRDAHATTVGVLICGEHNKRAVQYARNQSLVPQAVSTYAHEGLPLEERRLLPPQRR